MDTRKELLAAIDAIQTPGSFFTHGKTPTTNPQISVRGVGNITKSLEESQARIMIENAHQAPFGRGTKTLVDTSVRKTWEINPDQFDFLNTRWDDFIQSICDKVAKDLGIKSPIEAKLHKMLLYEKGGMFKTHTDSEKASGMFGTLVIGLPSAHTGGELVVTQGKESKEFKMHDDCISYAAWYSDVFHHIRPVESGYRWVLTYNLIFDPSHPRVFEVIPDSAIQKLRGVVKKWVSKNKTSRPINHAYYKLDHRYSQAAISMKNLKGQDLARVRTLRELSSDLDVEIFLLVLEKAELVGFEWLDDLEDGVDIRYNIRSCNDVNGHTLLESAKLDDSLVLQGKCFSDGDFEFLCEQEPMGNEGGAGTTFYRITAVAIVPRDSIKTFVLGRAVFGTRFGGMIGYIAGLTQHLSRDGPLYKDLKELCRRHWGRRALKEEQVFSPQGAAKVLQLALQFDDYEFFAKATKCQKGAISSAFFKWAGEQILSKNRDFGDDGDWVESAALSSPSFWERHEAIDALTPSGKKVPNEYRKWLESLTKRIFREISKADLCSLDGRAVAERLARFGKADKNLNGLMPTNANLKPYFFTLGFVTRLQELHAKNESATEDEYQIFKSITAAVIQAMHISDFEKADTVGLYDTLGLVQFVSTLIDAKDDPELLLAFGRKIVAEARYIKEEAYAKFWFPFLKELITLYEECGDRASNPACHQFPLAIFNSYIHYYVGKTPGYAQNYAQAPVDCICDDCHDLNRFITDPVQRIADFNVDKEKADHLWASLGFGDERDLDAYMSSDSTYTIVKPWARDLKGDHNLEGMMKERGAVEQLDYFDRDRMVILLGNELRNLDKWWGLHFSLGEYWTSPF
ncbi:hypothetical protein N7456_002531 [Penicillium angulare]|uniref:Prolyl 4-hydroxylase alpha subunit Fe(2+) 2OG dioxygenase domain-containing protein n=1 Tax=Penicillium angulare TaxID=116970 RepID=A0A9W9G8L2_9EURO|nr:hypothetical protein N7456_002531 [Penicillium angulare]